MPTDPYFKKLVAGAEMAGLIGNASISRKELQEIKGAATRANDQIANRLILVRNIKPENLHYATRLDENDFMFIEAAINSYLPLLKKAVKSFQDNDPIAKSKLKTFFMSETAEAHATVLEHLLQLEEFHAHKMKQSLFSSMEKYASDKGRNVVAFRKKDGRDIAAMVIGKTIYFNKEWLRDRIIDGSIQAIAEITLHEIAHIVFKYTNYDEDFAYSNESLEDFQKRDPSTIDKYNRSIYSLTDKQALKNVETYVELVFSF